MKIRPKLCLRLKPKNVQRENKSVGMTQGIGPANLDINMLGLILDDIHKSNKRKVANK